MNANSKTTTDQRIKLVISQDGMAASMILSKPQDDESQVTFDEVMAELQKSDIVSGIDEKAIRKCLSAGNVSTPVKIASGTKPNRGADSQFKYNFDITTEHKPSEDEDGNIDYHNINFIQNTTAGTVLVSKLPLPKGEPG